MNSSNLLLAAVRAVSRARTAILTIAVTYALSVVVGAVMVHAGNGLALDYLNNLVAKTQATDPSAIALQHDERSKAALFDFGGNLFIGAVPNTCKG